MGKKFGNQSATQIYLGERECSIQRRNQKVIEEAPSPFLDAATRRAMGEQAVALARAVGYFSAGTVEFIVDAQKQFYFLEMNTRLQVEHPVTELITGIDLVEEMIRVSAGEPLRLKQDDVKLNGWAIESRLYAEDPYRNFLPSIGRLTRYRPPVEGRRDDGTVVRIDTGVFEGGEISMYYDPMIAKLCTWAPERQTAIDAMGKALDDFEVEGIGHNLPFLSAVMDHSRFRDGRLTTAFIKEEYPDGFSGVVPTESDARVLAAVAAFVEIRRQWRDVQISGAMDNHRRQIETTWVVTLAEFALPIITVQQASAMLVDFSDGPALRVTSNWAPGSHHARFLVDGASIGVKTATSGTGHRLRWRGMDVLAHVRSRRAAELARLMLRKLPPDTSKMLLCPMPGVITAIAVGEGDAVEAGQILATVEAMKMENVLRAERKATVKRVVATAGMNMAVDELIMEFE